MYYARGRGCTPCTEVRGRRRRWRRKVKEGRERRRWQRMKGEYVCDVCGGHYEEPGVVARQRLSAPTYSHHPQPIPKTPLWDPPLPHGVLFLPFYVALSLVHRSSRFLFLYLMRRLTSTTYCSSIPILILIRWEWLDWYYCFRDNSW